MANINNYKITTEHYLNIIEEFKIYLQVLGYSVSTREQFPRYVTEFLYCQESESKYKIENLTSSEINQYYEYLQTRPSRTRSGGLSEQMVSHHLSALKVFYRWLEQSGVIKINPISGLSFPYPPYKHRAALTQQEISKLYAATETLSDKAMLGIFYGCGLRRSEGENLNTDDIKFNEKILIVREGKGLKRRVVPIAEIVKEDFENYYSKERRLNAGAKHQQAFMLNKKGHRMTRNSYNPRLRYLVKKAGLNKSVCLHQLRHSIATHLLEQGMSIEKVRDFLGHKFIDTTQRYTHINELKLQ